MTETRACCDDIIKAQEAITDHERRIKWLEDAFEVFVKDINSAMMYRLPLWATFALSAMSGVIGWLLASR